MLAEKLGLTEVHVSRLKHSNVKAIRLDTLYFYFKHSGHLADIVNIPEPPGQARG